MMKNEIHIAQYALLLSLLRASMGAGDMPKPGTDEQWKAALSHARRHAVFAVAYPAVRKMWEASLVPEKIYRAWRTDSLSAAIQDERVLAVQDKVLGQLRADGIIAAVHKGASTARCYPAVGMRAMGDVDILTRPACYDEAIHVLAEMGEREEGESGPYHTVFCVEGVMVELHKAIARIPEGAAGAAIQEVMAGMLDRTVKVSWSGHDFLALSCEDQAIALLMHMQKHMTACGIGLRQLCDWWAFVQSIPATRWPELCASLKRLGLMRYCEIMTRVCVRYLGLDAKAYGWCASVDDSLCRMAMEDILRSGNLYNGNDAQGRSGVFLGEVGHRSSPAGTFMKRLNQQVCVRYPRLCHAVVLRPGLWMLFVLDYLRRHRGEGSLFADGRIALRRRRLYQAAAFYEPNDTAQ